MSDCKIGLDLQKASNEEESLGIFPEELEAILLFSIDFQFIGLLATKNIELG